MNMPSPSRARHGSLIYLKHALLHPWHFLGLGLSLLFGILTGSLFFAAAAVIGELFLLTTLHRIPAFRRRVDEALEERRRAEAAKARSELLAQMHDGHRDELETLETIVDRVRRTLGRKSEGSAGVSGDCFGLNQLLARYTEIAITYEAGRVQLAAVSRRGLDAEISALRASRAHATARTAAMMDRRMLLLRKRVERWDQAREDLEIMVLKLAVISDCIRLVNECFTSARAPEAPNEEIDMLVSSLMEGEPSLRDIIELSAVSASVDPEVLELGRRHAELLAQRDKKYLSVIGVSGSTSEWCAAAVARPSLTSGN